MKAFVTMACMLAGLGFAGCIREDSPPEIDSQVIKATPLKVEKWNEAVAAAKSPPSPFIAKLEFITSPQLEEKTVDEVVACLPKDYPYSCVFIADAYTLGETGFPFWCIDLLDDKRPRFRVEARHIASVANNLALANMDFSDFADAAKQSGVFRGF